MGKLRQLLIPGKNSNKEVQPEYGIDMRAIEQWAIEVAKAIADAGGGYASLTGPGQTMTPGELNQEGDLDLAGSFNQHDGGANFTTDAGFSVTDSGTFGITLSEEGSAGISIDDTGGGGVAIASNGAVTIPAHDIGFFSGTGHTIITVTGSRGGNAALASLLTALADYGLIIDSSS